MIHKQFFNEELINIDIDFETIMAEHPQIDTDIIKDSDRLRKYAIGSPRTPEYLVSPALGTEKQRSINKSNIYYLT